MWNVGYARHQDIPLYYYFVHIMQLTILFLMQDPL